MIKFIARNLLLIHTGDMYHKFIGVVNLSIFPVLGLSIVERFTKWYIDNHLFILLILGALFADLFLGIWRHYKQKTFSFTALLTGFSTKIAVVTLAYFLCEGFTQIVEEGDIGSGYIKLAYRVMIFTYPTGNALVNMGIITEGKFPPLAFLKKFDKFNKTLDVNVFKQNEN